MKCERKTTLVKIVLIYMLGFSSTTMSSAEKKFSDVNPNSTHYEGINWLVEQGIRGFEDNRFGTYEVLTREHAAIMFVKALDLSVPPKNEVSNYFTDVKADHTYADYIAAAGKAGIFNGDKGKFKPDEVLTREQMATTLVNAYEFEANGADEPIDLSDVGSSHKESVQILADLQITTQLGNFRAKDAINRGQFATFLYESDKVEISE